MSIIAFFLSPVGRWLGVAGLALIVISGVYLKGHSDGKEAYRAKLAREIDRAIAKGETARAEALKKFDMQKEAPDDGFARD